MKRIFDKYSKGQPPEHTARLFQPNGDIARVLTVNDAIRTEEHTVLGQGLRVYAGLTIDDAVTIDTPVAIDDHVIRLTFSPGIVPAVGDYLLMKELVALYQEMITAVTLVTGDTYDIGMAAPFDYGFGSLAQFGVETSITLQNVNLAVNATQANPQIARVDSYGLMQGVQYNLYGASVLIRSTGSMDDGNFGSIDPLTHGVVVRVGLAGLLVKNTSTYRTNADFFLNGFTKTYPARTFFGVNAMNAITEFIPVSGTSVPLRHTTAMDTDYFNIIVQDDLSELDSLIVVFNGNITLDESFYYGE